MEVPMRTAVFVVLLLAVVVPARAQSVIVPPPEAARANLSGPRFGITSLSDGVVAKLAENYIDVNPVITQFGWQFEKQFYSKDSGIAAVNEWVVLVGGLDQGVALPSLSWLVGLRTKDGTEFGFGPNLSPAGVAFTFAAGMTVRTGFLNVPMNIAVVPSRSGTRISFLTGFSMKRE